jgi:hypothetical protein
VTVTNRHPADGLADIRSEIKRLTIREGELRAYLLEHPDDREGDDYVVSIASQSRKRVDLKRLADEIGASLLQRFTATPRSLPFDCESDRRSDGMLDRPPSAAALRSRRKRTRRKRGVVVYSIEAKEADVIEALIRSNRLSEAETRQIDLIEAALAEVIADWTRRWVK